MKKIVIYGTTVFSRELRYYIESDYQGEVVAFVLDREYIDVNEFDDLPIIPYEDLLTYYKKDEIEILISLGYSKMNDNRKAVFEKCKNDGWEIGSFIHSSALNLADYIGMGNIVMDKAEIRLHAKIGDGNILLPHVCVDHDNCVGNFNYFAGGCHVCGLTTIGNNNFLGANSILENGLTIQDYNLIGAGTCLSKDLGNENVVTSSAVKVRSLNKQAMDLLLMNKFQI